MYVSLYYSDYVLLNHFVEPEMFQLYKIVVPKILAHWEEVAYISFHCDISKVEAIEAKQNGDPKKCCQELVKHWMQTEKAKTWETLLKQLKEVDKLTANVEEILHQLLSVK